jgi:hypothetical protein
MDAKPDPQLEALNQVSEGGLDRRELARKLGRFAAYAAPFTVLATTASAASGSGGGKHPKANPAP